MKLMAWIFAILIVWNLAAFCAMGWDKRQAQRQGQRIAERRLLLWALCFGGLGIALGMAVFHHKTKHLRFRIFVPLSVFLNGAVAGILLWLLYQRP